MPFHISPKLLKYFKGFCSSPEIIMLFVYMKCRFSLSYRDLEEMASIRGAEIARKSLKEWQNKKAARENNKQKPWKQGKKLSIQLNTNGKYKLVDTDDQT